MKAVRDKLRDWWGVADVSDVSDVSDVVVVLAVFIVSGVVLAVQNVASKQAMFIV
jgi:hypothetical protein